MTFRCHGCGQCCRIAKLYFGEGWEHGYVGMACAQLDESTGRCKIYATRPDVCRVSYALEIGIPELEISLTQPCRVGQAKHPNRGTTLDSFLEEKGVRDEFEDRAIKERR